MGDDLRRQIYLNFSHHETEELLEIWRAHDCNEWSETTFDVIREILQERHVELPPLGQPAHETQKKPRKSKPAMMRGVQQAQHVEPRPQKEMMRPADSRGAEPVRPQTVIYAVYLAAGALAIQATLGVVNLVTGQFEALVAAPQFVAVVGLAALVFLVLEAVIIYNTWLGRNGPRIFYIGLILFFFLFGLINQRWTEAWSEQPLRTSLSTLATCLELIAVALLVSPRSNAWFRELRPARSSEEQTTQRKKRSSQRRRSPTWLSELSPDRWVRHYTFGTLATSFAVGLLAPWLVYNLVLWHWGPDYPFDSYLNIVYAMMCLPLQVTALILGAVIGATSAWIPEAKWRRATYGVWIATLFAILSAILGAVGIPTSGS